MGGTVTELLEGLRVALPQEPVRAPDFRLEAVNGPPVHLTGLGGRLMFLNFWATWCKPCRREMPAMERLHRAYRDRGLAVVAVNFRESREEVKAFLEEMGLSFAAPLDLDGRVTRAYGVRALPATYLVDRDGKILWKAQGPREWDAPHGRAYFERVLAARYAPQSEVPERLVPVPEARAGSGTRHVPGPVSRGVRRSVGNGSGSGE
jgi:thiol-disulfide isomerase/thioredoxin